MADPWAMFRPHTYTEAFTSGTSSVAGPGTISTLSFGSGSRFTFS